MVAYFRRIATNVGHDRMHPFGTSSKVHCFRIKTVGILVCRQSVGVFADLAARQPVLMHSQIIVIGKR